MQQHPLAKYIFYQPNVWLEFLIIEVNLKTITDVLGDLLYKYGLYSSLFVHCYNFLIKMQFGIAEFRTSVFTAHVDTFILFIIHVFVHACFCASHSFFQAFSSLVYNGTHP